MDVMVSAKEHNKQDLIIDLLNRAGCEGMTRSSFGSQAGTELFKNALRHLIQEGRVVSWPKTRPRLFTKAHAPNLEDAANTLDQKLSEAPPKKLWNKDRMRKLLSPVLRPFFDDVLPLLIADGILFEFRQGRTRLYVHLGALDRARSHSAIAMAPSVLERMRDAYARLRATSEMPFVSIAALMEASDLPKDIIHETLAAESKAGRASLSVGDWSLATPDVRAAALSLGGKSFVSVAFHESP